MIALFLDVFGDLVAHFRSRRIAPRGIAKYKGVVELDLFDKLACLFVISLRLPGKTDNHIGGNRDSIAPFPDAIDKIDIFLRAVRPMHRFQDFVGT